MPFIIRLRVAGARLRVRQSRRARPYSASGSAPAYQTFCRAFKHGTQRAYLRFRGRHDASNLWRAICFSHGRCCALVGMLPTEPGCFLKDNMRAMRWDMAARGRFCWRRRGDDTLIAGRRLRLTIPTTSLYGVADHRRMPSFTEKWQCRCQHGAADDAKAMTSCVEDGDRLSSIYQSSTGRADSKESRHTSMQPVIPPSARLFTTSLPMILWPGLGYQQVSLEDSA